jgi:uncharacterized protein YecE (DUF72 family)
MSASVKSGAKGTIRIGVGGWTFEDWRGPFYPQGHPQKSELEYASRKLTSIEINGTYYRSQKPESFAKWHDETPDDFVFAVKGPRFATNRRVLAEAGESVERFFNSGVFELKEKLGPINWQFMATKKFEPQDFEEFLKLLPVSGNGRQLRHVVEVRHESFRTKEFIALLRRYGIAAVLAADSKYPQIADPTADFVYARLMGTGKSEKLGYSDKNLDLWAARARSLASGGIADGLEVVDPENAAQQARDVFIYVIAGEKVKNPAAAMALISRLR